MAARRDGAPHIAAHIAAHAIMDAATLNTVFHEAVLYYVFVNDDTTHYRQDLGDIGEISYDPETGYQYMATWFINTCPKPDNDPDLLAFTAATVTTYFADYYVWPDLIYESQPDYFIATSDLNAAVVDSSFIGFHVFDTTAQSRRVYNGSTWDLFNPTIFLPLDGTRAMTDDLEMGDHNIMAVRTLYQSTPSAISMWTAASGGISFTANTARSIPLGSFTQTLNPNGDFTGTTSTGQVTYTGATTRLFRVTICYSVTALAPISTQTLTVYLMQTGSTTIAGPRNTWTFITLGQLTTAPGCVAGNLLLAQNDTVQLGGIYTASSTITFRDISVDISQV